MFNVVNAKMVARNTPKYGVRYSEITDQLTELARPRTRDKAEWILINAGYRHINRGANGAVYQKPGTSYVLKLFDSRDQAYLSFVELAMANPNPHFPRFFGKLVPVTEDYSAVRIEFLEPCTRHAEVHMIDQYIIKQRDRLTGMNGSFGDGIWEFMEANPDLKQACDLIVGLLVKNKKFFCDVYLANVMMRGSTIVLSDPIGVAS